MNFNMLSNILKTNYEQNFYDVNKITAPGGLETEKLYSRYERQ